MAINLTTGSQIAVAKTYGTAATMTAITNAAEAVATLSAGHGVVVGDWLEMTSGWSALDKRLVRVKTVSTNDVTLEGVNTSSTARFPAGSGTGTVRKVSAWTYIGNIDQISMSGGDMQYVDATTIGDMVSKQIPTVRSAVSMDITLFEDMSASWFADLKAASDATTPYGFLLVLSSGARMGGNAYWSMSPFPNVQKNDVVRSSVSLAFAAEPTRYAT